MADGNTPIETGIDNAIRKLAQNALRRIESADSLIATAALALRQQNVDCDSAIADTLDHHAWTEIDEARNHLKTLLGVNKKSKRT